MIAAALGLAAIALYGYAVRVYDRRYPARAFSWWRIAAFVCGVAVMTFAVMPPMDARADDSFAAHMVQHILLVFAGPPLVLLGAPLLLLVAVPTQRVARRITGFTQSAFGHAFFAPVTGWLAYVAVLWAAHFSPLYEAALEHPGVHVFEHALFVGSAFLFWGAIVQIGYVPRPVPYVVRVLYLFIAIPQGAFLAFALNAAQRVLYPHYVGATGSAAAALADQHAGADVMWILGGFLLFVAFMCTVAAWAASERGAAAAS
jgi:cytochrome c oxidase assembly factor CtaG